MTNNRYQAWSALLMVTALLPPAAVWAVTQADVDAMEKHCFAAREKALAPIRARKTQACIEQQLRSVEHCERYYTTYGNVSPGPTGAPQYGLFWDLPECRDWIEARKTLEQARSEP